MSVRGVLYSIVLLHGIDFDAWFDRPNEQSAAYCPSQRHVIWTFKYAAKTRNPSNWAIDAL